MYTENPVVLIHGFFGWGKTSPFFNCFPRYWPEEVLSELNPNYVIVDVGTASSDHDRACEAFYQLKGGRVNYGEQHSKNADHDQYGAYFDTPLYREWDENNPVHLVGHSYGATTALELYQLICKDHFGFGTNYKWVASITSIAGPLSGSTLTHILGLKFDNTIQRLGVGHWIGIFCGIVLKCQQYFPILKNVYDFRIPQWEKHRQWRKLISTKHPFNTSYDNVYHSLSPALRQQKNNQLVDMDKIFLLSIVCKENDRIYPSPMCLLGTIGLLVSLRQIIGANSLSRNFKNIKKPTIRKLGIFSLLLLLIRIIQKVDFAQLPVFQVLRFFIRMNCKRTPSLYAGFNREMWLHNDGVVNTYSMLYPRPLHKLTTRTPSYCSFESTEGIPRVDSHTSIDMQHQTHHFLERGRWYVYRLEKNHLCGTGFDKTAKDLYQNIFCLLNSYS